MVELVSGEDTNGQIYFNPAVLAVPPYETKGRSLYGNFSLRTKAGRYARHYTAEAWIRLFSERAAVVMRVDSGMESIAPRAGVKGAAEAAYGATEAGGITGYVLN